MMPDTALLTVKEVAFLLRVSPQTVYGWCYQGKLAAVRVVGSIRIDRRAAEGLRQAIGERCAT